jgi:hypothetical protein
VKYIVGFAAFWRGAIFGDSVVLAVVGSGSLAFAYLVVLVGTGPAVSIALPLMVILFVGLSLLK